MTQLANAEAAPALEQALRSFYPVVIAGEERSAADGGAISLVDPRTGREFASAAAGGAEEIAQAVVAAKAAYPGWRDTIALERGRHLISIGRALRAQADTLGRLESLNNGRALAECLAEVEGAAQMFEFYGGLAAGMEGSVFQATRPGTFSFEVREPYGVTGHIIPWNAPLLLAARGIAPALAVGNTVVAKPADETPITCLELERIAREAGVPPGVLNVVPGRGPEAGAALAAHPDVPRITFTGSLETGRLIQAAAAPRMCHVTLELGGKSPNIVFADADLDLALGAASRAILGASGQACVAGSRLLVSEAIHERFVDELATTFTDLARADEGPEKLAPLISAKQLERVRGFIESGRTEGARLVAGGQDGEADGFYVDPVLFDDVRPDMTIFQQEIFGPVLAVTPFASEEEAIALANASSYGLAAGLWTGSVPRLLRILPQLEVGMVYVNGYLNAGVEAPFGGYKLSGFGHEKGRLAMDEYTRVKAVTVSFA